MKNNGASESHTNNSLKTNMAFAKFLGPHITFYNVKRREEIIAFLDTKIKNIEVDPDRKSPTPIIMDSLDWAIGLSNRYRLVKVYTFAIV